MCVCGGGGLRHPGRRLGEQGQEVPWTTDGSSLVPFEGHKVTEGARVTLVKERVLTALAGCIPASSSGGTRGTARSGRKWNLSEG